MSSGEIGVGSVIDGKYEIVQLLGVGGMGEVFKARHVHLKTHRCIKVMRKSLVADEDMKQRFVREAILATKVHHPSIAIIHDFSETGDGAFYMVTEFVDGLTLRQWATTTGPFAPTTAVEIAIQALEGLGHCHSRGLLHRDVSSDNIMILLESGAKPLVKIIDLGIAKVFQGAAVGEQTRTGLYIGNPKYSSPEQLGAILEGEELDERTDVYSLGVVLYELIAGVVPFRSTTPQGYVAKHLTVPPPHIQEVAPSLQIPEGLEEVLFKALAKDRENRYRNAEEFVEALNPYRLGKGTPDQLHFAKSATAARSLAEARRTEEKVQQTPTPAPPARTPTPSPRTPAAGPAPAEPLQATESVSETSLPPTPSSTATIVTPGHSSRGPLIAAALGIAAATVAGLYWMERQDPVEIKKDAVSESRRSAALSTGLLQIDASPWAEIESIEGVDGRNLLQGKRDVTPTGISVPPGVYAVTIFRKGGRPERQTISATVRAGDSARVMASLGPVDTASFLELRGKP